MTIARLSTQIVRGPAAVIFDSQVIYFKGGLTVTPKYELFKVDADAAGAAGVEQRIKQILFEVTGTPVGKLTTGMLAVLYPHTQCNPGGSAMPATDKTIVIHPLNGKEKLTLNSGIVTKMPDLMLGATKTALGSITFTAIGTDNAAWSVADHMYTLADAAFTDTSLASSGIPSVPYTAALGALTSPWNAIQTKDGWTVSIDAGLEPQEVDDTGIYDWMYTGEASITAKCRPIGIKVADLLGLMNIQGSGISRGMSILNKKYDLVLVGTGGLTATLKNMTLQSAPHVYNVGDRVENLELKSVRNLTTGALDVLFSLAMTA